MSISILMFATTPSDRIDIHVFNKSNCNYVMYTISLSVSLWLMNNNMLMLCGFCELDMCGFCELDRISKLQSCSSVMLTVMVILLKQITCNACWSKRTGHFWHHNRVCYDIPTY